jgi:hypothetical protein
MTDDEDARELKRDLRPSLVRISPQASKTAQSGETELFRDLRNRASDLRRIIRAEEE